MEFTILIHQKYKKRTELAKKKPRKRWSESFSSFFNFSTNWVSSRNNTLAVIIDNTNIRHDECRTYFQKAARYGYLVIIVEPRTSWKRDADILARSFFLLTQRKKISVWFLIFREKFAQSSERSDRSSTETLPSDHSVLFRFVSQWRRFERNFTSRARIVFEIIKAFS